MKLGLTMPQGVFNSKISQVMVLEELEGSRMVSY
jgi:hypothetical protein